MLPAHYSKKEANYFCRFTFGQFFTILVLEIFTLFFIFYLGARYGGELLGVKPPPAPVAQTEGLPQVTSTDPNVVATTQDPEIKALAKDLVKQASTPDLKQRVQEMLEESGSKPSAKQSLSRFEFKTAPKAEVPAKPQTAPEAYERQRPPPVVQTAPPNARYSVQIASYLNADEAYAMVDSWKAKGYPAYLVSADIPGKGRWYRVRVGGFDNKEEAQAYLKKVRAKEDVGGFVVTNE